MSDLTPERRAELRRSMEFARGGHYAAMPLSSLTALLDAADERDRLDEVESRFSALLWRLTNGRLSKTSYPVEFMEQEIEECLAEYRESDIRDERDRLAAAVERVREVAAERTEPPYAWESADGWSDGYDQAMKDVRRALDGTEDPTT